MGKLENVEEELLKMKKTHSFSLREIAIMRTRIKILEKECKKKEQQIDDLLKNDQFATKSEQKLQLNSLKRKVVQFERSLREKTEEVAKLLSDQNTAKAAETRRQLEVLNIECARLRKYLSQSIPQSEFLNEKQQYMDIISQLTEENIKMRMMIGDFRNKQGNSIDGDLVDEEAVMEEIRSLTIAQKKESEYYKNALNSLITRRNSALNSRNSWDQKSPKRKTTASNRSRSANAKAESKQRPTKTPTNKKFPIRSQPLVSRIDALRSKSIEESSVINKRRLSRQLSDANLTSISRANSDIDGQEILLPERRKPHTNVAMYRNALESESSSGESYVEQNRFENVIKDGQVFKPIDRVHSKEDEKDDVNDAGETFSLEVYDSRGNVYYIEPELDEEELNQNVADSDSIFDPHEISEEFKQKSTDNWIEIASLLSGNQVELNGEEMFIRSLHSHTLRLRMLQIRHESL